MSAEKQSFWKFGPQQIIAGLCTGFAVSPINTIVDRSVIQCASGKTELWVGVREGFKQMFFQPKVFFRAYYFKWVLAVYHATYVTSNLADHYVIPNLDPAISKLFSVFVVNTTLSLMKDKALAQYFSHKKRPNFPPSSLGFFFLRDVITMAAAFTIPPILGKFIEKKWNYSQNTSFRMAQLVLPVMIQLITTPIHLFGLDLFNNPDSTFLKRLTDLKKIYISTVSLRMLRFLPAFGFGGIVNKEMRNYLLKKDH